MLNGGPGSTKIGIIGGGQLGRMMIVAGTPLGFRFGVVTPSRDDPAAGLAEYVEPGTLHDAGAIDRITAWADVTTYEIEHIDTDALDAAVAAGRVVLPDPSVLRTVNDKLVQKQRLADADIPVPRFFTSLPGYPIVQKLRRGGYDGRGVAVLRSSADVALAGESFYEELVDIERELAVVVARSSNGEECCYPVAEMEFDAQANICASVAVPAAISVGTESDARRIALESVRAIGAVGVVAVELFLTRDGTLLVNELAPRPHNSGHLTIEAAQTSQFEQHLRAVAGLPLGPADLRTPAVMINMLGAPRAYGVPRMPGFADLLRSPGVHVHWYGKREVRPFRKMGHITVVASTIDEAWERARAARCHASVEGADDAS